MYVTKLATWLKVVDYAARHPHVRDQKIERPVFVMGMPRTGTTLTSYLLGSDRNAARCCAGRWRSRWPPTTATLYANPVIDGLAAFDRQMEETGRSFAASDVTPVS